MIVGVGVSDIELVSAIIHLRGLDGGRIGETEKELL
jgi:hypothetical protein